MGCESPPLLLLLTFPGPLKGALSSLGLYLPPGLLTTLVRAHARHLVTPVPRQHQAVTHTSLTTSPIHQHSFGHKHLRLDSYVSMMMVTSNSTSCCMKYTCMTCPCLPSPNLPCPCMPCPCMPCNCMRYSCLAQHKHQTTGVTSSTCHDALQVLVELAQERDEDIPALVYEARSTGQPRRLNRPQQRQQQQRQHNRHEQQESRGQGGASPVATLQEVTVAQSSPRVIDQLQRGSSKPHLPARPPQAQTSGLCLGYAGPSVFWPIYA